MKPHEQPKLSSTGCDSLQEICPRLSFIRSKRGEVTLLQGDWVRHDIACDLEIRGGRSEVGGGLEQTCCANPNGAVLSRADATWLERTIACVERL